MKRYLIALFCFVAFLFGACCAFWGDISDWLTFYLLLCIPFVVFGVIALLMGHALSRTDDSGKIIFPQSAFNFQISFSALYICVIFYLLFVSHDNSKTATTAQTNCSSDNLQLLSSEDANLERKYLMAYDSLKCIVNNRVKIKTDTAICLEGLFSNPIDTTINGYRMTTRIILIVSLPSRQNSVFKYFFCCNDSIGFTVNKYPVARL